LLGRGELGHDSPSARANPNGCGTTLEFGHSDPTGSDLFADVVGLGFSKGEFNEPTGKNCGERNLGHLLSKHHKFKRR
jgi:hypothetical protein